MFLSLFVELAVFAADVLCVDIVYQLQTSLYLPVKLYNLVFIFFIKMISLDEIRKTVFIKRYIKCFKSHLFLSFINIFYNRFNIDRL